MSKRILSKILVAVAVMLASVSGFAQSFGSYTPYSIYGIGDIAQPGTSYSKSMGSVGIAGRNNHFINVINPAAVTARDSLSLMMDFSMYLDNKIFKQDDMKSASNTANIGACVVSFPIWKSSAMMIGVMPYSSTGYGYYFNYQDPEVISKSGNVTYSATGQGAIYQVFAAAGATFWKKLSVGAEGIYYFGQTSKDYYQTFTDESYNSVNNGFDMSLGAFSGKFGLQFEQSIGKKGTICVGATYTLGANLKGYVEEYKYASGSAAIDTLKYVVDTLANNPGRVKMAGEWGVGIAYRYADKFSIEVDYTRSDWRSSGFSDVRGFKVNSSPSSEAAYFTPGISESIRLGMEYTPNRNDVRYYMKRVSYRVGAYYKKDYFKVDGHDIYSAGITLGATLPVFRWYNGISVGMELGQRGSMKNSLIRERYINFTLGVNLFDIWFQKPKYE